MTTNYPKGTVLTCAHEGCPCRVEVMAECHCDDGGQPYRCACGADMVPVQE